MLEQTPERKEVLKKYPKPTLREGTMAYRVVEYLKLHPNKDIPYKLIVENELNYRKHNKSKNYDKNWARLRSRWEALAADPLTAMTKEKADALMKEYQETNGWGDTLEVGYSQMIALLLYHNHIERPRKGFYRIKQ